MKRSEIKRKTPLKPGKPLERKSELSPVGKGKPASDRRKPTLRRGRGFAAHAAQRDKVRGRACAACGQMADEYRAIDPAHLCARGLGGCDDPACVIPLCRTMDGGCHGRFDRGELDLAPYLEPGYRAEVAHCVTHLGLYGTLRRLSPSSEWRDAA